MRPTVQWLLNRGELGLRALVDTGAQRCIRWVHASELADPTPYLSGGELLLTTGLHDKPWHGYVDRLVRCGVVALGFGVGPHHERVPDELVGAAGESGLALLEVPEPTPFIAISEAVAAAISYAQEDALASALATQRELITAAVSTGGPRAVVTGLAEALDAWVLLLDESGAARHCSPPHARRYAASVRAELDRMTMTSLLHSASLALGDQQVAVLPVGTGGSVAGYLAAGRRAALTTPEHSVLASAVGLLALDVVAQRQARDARRDANVAVLRLAASGHPDLAESCADTLGVALPPAPLRVALLSCEPGDIRDLLRAAEDHPALTQAGALVARYDRHSVVVLLPVAEGDLQALEEVLHRVARSRGVVSDGVQPADVPDALRRTRSVFFGTTRGGDRLVLAKDVATAGLLAQLDHPGARGWADALLEPLERHASRSKLDLVSTLRVYLANNSHIDASSTALGIHRHTLRYRLRRISELLDTDLDDPTARAELWLALRMREMR
ncbi:PucR family transcriptional regulator [Prauserella oleivorans]|uniref:PucR family transcriptional regulator n=1 Tax=Prauserella oleivorans TaxID=1478153 RepID=A0ABW5WH93_9PSEU